MDLEYLLNRFNESDRLTRKEYRENLKKSDIYFSINQEGEFTIHHLEKQFFDNFYEIYQFLNADKDYYIWYFTNWKPSVRVKAKSIPSKYKNIKERDGNKCTLCDSVSNLTIDHIYNYASSGDDTYYNLMTLCNSCNQSKGSRILSTNFVSDTLVPTIKERNKLRQIGLM